MERHVDELLLMNLSEQFYENAEAVKFVRDMMLQNPHPQDPEGFARQLAASSRHDTADRLAELSLPVHVIGGEHDILVPVWKSKELAELIDGAKLTVLPGAPHGLSLERAQEFNDLVLGFIAEHEPAPRLAEGLRSGRRAGWPHRPPVRAGARRRGSRPPRSRSNAGRPGEPPKGRQRHSSAR